MADSDMQHGWKTCFARLATQVGNLQFEDMFKTTMFLMESRQLKKRCHPLLLEIKFYHLLKTRIKELSAE